ncbi:MAG: hypothetical protein HY875_12165 [Chloroflexi bacterium]|nr:hypothetical protein [Chloroflexota bacterium]
MLRLHLLALSELAQLHDPRLGVARSAADVRDAELRRQLAELRREPRPAASRDGAERGFIARLRLVISRGQAS